MRRFVAASIYMMLILCTSVSAQETRPLNLPSELYFNTFSGSHEISKSLYRVQDSPTADPVLTTQKTIMDYVWTSDGNKIALIINDNGATRAEIYSSAFELITQVEINLFKNDTYHYPVTWADDGKHLATVSEKAADIPYISIIPVDSLSNTVEQVISVPEAEDLSRIYWSPNAKYMLYQTLLRSDAVTRESIPQPESHKLYLLDLETRKTKLVTNTSFNNCIAWSSDGDRFASVSNFHRDLDTFQLRATHLEIYDLNAKVITEFDTNLTFDKAIGCPISWSNNGQNIAALYSIYIEPSEFESGIATIDLQTQKIQPVGIPNPISYSILSMNWSPDDSWVAIETLYNAYGDIRLFPLDTGEEIILTVGDGVPMFNPKWRITSE
ncbi:MAG: hypothetical protein LCI00_29910 [Chloroflexi bacterium]|nr:hypothetical protein [Chloroflexota bacterium]MCC6893438.1 PD40 domain-containing protein [Anaerolineae bacterium]